MNWLAHLMTYLFPPVRRSVALDLARQALAHTASTAALICHGRKPAGFRIYGDMPEPCWWIVAPRADGKDDFALRSSRVIAVGKQTGKVHYDGSAGDEG
jgi:hypothetical protein